MNNHVWQDDQPPYEDKKPWWNSRPLIVVALALVIVLGLSLVWQILSADDGAANEVPYISADTTPEKVKPEDAGGEEIPHQDKKIYDLIDGSDGKVVRTVAAVENADREEQSKTPSSGSFRPLCRQIRRNRERRYQKVNQNGDDQTQTWRQADRSVTIELTTTNSPEQTCAS